MSLICISYQIQLKKRNKAGEIRPIKTTSTQLIKRNILGNLKHHRDIEKLKFESLSALIMMMMTKSTQKKKIPEEMLLLDFRMVTEKSRYREKGNNIKPRNLFNHQLNYA